MYVYTYIYNYIDTVWKYDAVKAQQPAFASEANTAEVSLTKVGCQHRLRQPLFSAAKSKQTNLEQHMG